MINTRLPRSDLLREQMTVVPVSKRGDRGSFTVYECERPDGLDVEWQVRLSSQQPVELNKPIDARIYRVNRDTSTIFVSASLYGTSELAQTHKERFLDASKYVVQLPDYNAPTADDLDHEKILFAREMLRFCIRRNEADWLAVFELLGKPSINILEDAYELMEGLRTAVRDGENEAISGYIANLSDLGVLSWYDAFIQNVEGGNQYQQLPNDELLEKLYSLNPDEFEHFVADCWKEQGFTAEVTSQEDDLGIDILAERQKPWREKHAIQVKRYHPDSTINLDVVRSYAAIDKMGGADKAFIVTTSRFTENARKAAESMNVELIDGIGLTEFINDEGLHNVVAKYLT